ncbi:MAG: hypothetical protein E7285_07690 [Lachnospiraceae bacterium]|nr:hypothetical protein [Lachnospiraceae bacterium]
MERNKKEQVKKILLTPIVCIKWNKAPFLYDGKIYSGQKYYGNPDEDMSDFAVNFYNILYKNNIQDNNILAEKKDKKIVLRNKNYAGDTMNSFISIANMASFEPNDDNIKEKVMNYYDIYHCLANFWVIPMKIGRGSKKLNRYDSLDIFLERIETKEKYDEIMGKYGSDKGEEYNKRIEYENFKKIHFIEKYVPDKEILKRYHDKQAGDLIDRATDMIKTRAEKISEDEKIGDELYKYFQSIKLI